ncbi:MAG: DUF4394 domain-containing protein [Blastocatellia bacterium]|nr:DUF4394 domain-containing protein [Blastocatellia bacterium]
MKYVARTLLFFLAVSLLTLAPLTPAKLVAHRAAAQQQTANGDIVYALTTNNSLLTFSVNTPQNILTRVAITGLQANENLLGIDFRPATGQLFGLGSTSRVYIINPSSGVATSAGSAPFTPALTGNDFGFDFNPVPDRIRVFSESDQNLRLNPNNGAVAGTDTNLAYAAGDRNAGQNPNGVAAAYTNNFNGTPATTLYVIDSTLDIVARMGDFDGAPISPNSGQLFTVGSLGVNTTGLAGFDVAATDGTAYASLTVSGETNSSLYRVNLGTGRAAFLGSIGPVSSGELIRDISVAPRVNIYGLTNNNQLVVFDGAQPGVILNRLPVTGLQTGENLVGIDFRPATGQLYGLGSGSRVYLIDKATGVARQVGSAAFTPALDGASFGFDFNPVPDRIRVTSNTTQNLRLNPDTGGVAATDTKLAYTAGDKNEKATPNVVGSAYTNNFNGTTATTLYDIDSALDILVIQNPPNDGKLNTVGSLGFDTSDAVGFDISTVDGAAFAAAVPTGGTTSNLYRVNLTTGAATLVGSIGNGEVLRDISVENIQCLLAINMSDAPDPVKTGGTLTYTITVNNFGPGPATNVVVTDLLPALTTFDSATVTQGSVAMATANGATTVTATLGSIPIRGSATITIVTKVPGTTSGVVTNVATVISGSGDLNRANNTATSITTITQ